jgi:hypothetical protein
LAENVVIVCGSEDFIINIGQQVAWLAGACSLELRHEGIVYAYVDLNEIQNLYDGVPQFRIGVKVEDPLPNETRYCWNSIVGSTSLIAGFPILAREKEERGLEVSIQLMTALVGIPEAVTYRNSYVFKGRYHAFVPVAQNEGSVQWHLIDTSPKKLKWTDIDEQCPGRVSIDLESDGYLCVRNFVGWCCPVQCLLGMY